MGGGKLFMQLVSVSHSGIIAELDTLIRRKTAPVLDVFLRILGQKTATRSTSQ